MEEELKIYSDEVRDILSEPPKLIYKWGNTILFLFILILLILSWFIKYPDIVQGQVKLTTEQPPSRLVSQTDGYIEKLFIKNDISISKGEVIATIKSPINKKSIVNLSKALSQIDDTIAINQLHSLSNIGLLQDEVNTLTNNLIEYHNIKANSYFKNNIKNLAYQVEYNSRLALITKQELDLLKIEISNAKDKFEADSLLFEQKVIAKHTFYKNQSEYFTKKQQFINVKKTYIQYKIASNNYEKQRIDALKNYEDQKRQYESAIVNSKNLIETSITNWQQNFELIAPINGKLSYLNSLSEQQYVQSGQALFAIIPDQKSILGIVKITDQAFGKVKVGQTVRMKFDNYPYQEFGQLIGSVFEISKIPSEQGYFVKVFLEKGLTTTYNKEIEYKPEMIGIAEIVTEDLRLIERVFNNIRKIVDR